MQNIVTGNGKELQIDKMLGHSIRKSFPEE